jgi:hypothetical protein
MITWSPTAKFDAVLRMMVAVVDTNEPAFASG